MVDVANPALEGTHMWLFWLKHSVDPVLKMCGAGRHLLCELISSIPRPVLHQPSLSHLCAVVCFIGVG